MSKFYVCKVCGNLIEKIEDSGIAPFCCGKKMTYLEPNETEASTEKHIPVVTVHKITGHEECSTPMALVHIEVGSTPHPALNNHYIKWIHLQTDKNIYRRYLEPGLPPAVDFIISCEEKIINVYAFCNIHGLWSTSKVIK